MSRRFLLVLIPLALLTATAGGWLAYSQHAWVTHLAASTFSATSGLFGASSGAEDDAGAPVEYGLFMEMQGLVVNPSGTEGRRYLMAHIGFESDEQDALEELKDREIVVRDVILRLLGRRTVAELSASEQRAELKEELRTAVNDVLQEGAIDRLYFTQYVLQ